MSNTTTRARRWRAVAGLVGALVVVPAASSWAAGNPGVHPPGSSPHGATYGEWAARWWQWALSAPVPENPVLDTTGVNCDYGQSGSVWFLAGTFGGTATRTCDVPAGRALVFPVLNAASIATEPEETEQYIHDRVKARMDAVDTSLLAADIDEVPVSGLDQYRAHSPTFFVELPEDNVFGAPSGTYGPAAADGFWLALAPLRPGDHTVHFGGTFPNGTSVSVTYHLHVIQP